MAITAETFKKPSTLLILGVTIVGGFILASRFRKGSETPTIVTPTTVSSGVTSFSAETRADALQTELTNAKAARDELEDQIERERREQLARYEELEGLSREERLDFERRLETVTEQEKSRYSSEKARLDAEIARLANEIERLKAQPSPNPQPLPQPLPNTPQQPQLPPRSDVPTQGGVPQGGAITSGGLVRQPPWIQPYPGIGWDWQLLHPNTFTGLYVSSLDDVTFGSQRSGVASDRNRVAIALQGNVTPWIGLGSDPWGGRDTLNQIRRRNGLYPLTDAEMDQVAALIDSYGGLKEPYNRKLLDELFNRYNLPYRRK